MTTDELNVLKARWFDYAQQLQALERQKQALMQNAQHLEQQILKGTADGQ